MEQMEEAYQLALAHASRSAQNGKHYHDAKLISAVLSSYPGINTSGRPTKSI